MDTLLVTDIMIIDLQARCDTYLLAGYELIQAKRKGVDKWDDEV